MVLIMKTNTTKTNTKTNETKSTVKPVVTKTVETKTAKTEKPVAVKPVEKPVKTNETKTNKLYSFNEVMKLFDEYNIGSNSNTKSYRIINGGSSLHVLQREFRLYATNDDFNAISGKNISDVKCVKNDNARDKNRPHTITITNNNSLIEVIKVLALNKLNAPR